MLIWICAPVFQPVTIQLSRSQAMRWAILLLCVPNVVHLRSVALSGPVQRWQEIFRATTATTKAPFGGSQEPDYTQALRRLGMLPSQPHLVRRLRGAGMRGRSMMSLERSALCRHAKVGIRQTLSRMEGSSESGVHHPSLWGAGEPLHLPPAPL